MHHKRKVSLKLSELTKVIICFCVLFGAIVWIARDSSIIRLDHFASLATIVGSLATAGTLIWLVLERDQLQKEKREAAKISQANGVSAWLMPKSMQGNQRTRQAIVLNNNSDSPIYNLVISIVNAQDKSAQGEKAPEDLRLVVDASPPGQSLCFVPRGYSNIEFHPGVEVAFSDASTNHWVRRSNGKLEDLPGEPLVYYNIPRSVPYEPLHKL